MLTAPRARRVAVDELSADCWRRTWARDDPISRVVSARAIALDERSFDDAARGTAGRPDRASAYEPVRDCAETPIDSSLAGENAVPKRTLGVCTTNRNLVIYDDLIIDTSVDEFVFGLNARTRELVWETQVLEYRTHAANQSTGPIITNGKVISGRSCMPAAGPDAYVITAHDPHTGEELGGGAPSCGPASRATKRGAACPTSSAGTSGPGWRPATISS